jgi:hypothetical protein
LRLAAFSCFSELLFDFGDLSAQEEQFFFFVDHQTLEGRVLFA